MNVNGTVVETAVSAVAVEVKEKKKKGRKSRAGSQFLRREPSRRNLIIGIFPPTGGV
jgi:hypothetical protein